MKEKSNRDSSILGLIYGIFAFLINVLLFISKIVYGADMEDMRIVKTVIVVMVLSFMSLMLSSSELSLESPNKIISDIGIYLAVYDLLGLIIILVI